MFSERLLQVTFLISLLTHGVILSQNPGAYFFVPSAKKDQKIQVSYVRAPRPVNKEPKPMMVPLKREPFLKLPDKITARKGPPPPYMEQDAILKPNTAPIVLREGSFIKPALNKPDVIAIKKKITLPAVGVNKNTNPSYISYYQLVREKIRRCAYYNYSHTETGEAFVTFVISSDGYLKDVRLVEDKSSPSAYLKEIALRSVRDASPFPNFPKDLDYPSLSFNVIISFEIE